MQFDTHSWGERWEGGGSTLPPWTAFPSSLQDNTSSQPAMHFSSSMVACMCSALLPETKGVRKRGSEEGEGGRGGEGGGAEAERQTIPLALPASDRWHRELIPGLGRVSPSTAPSRVSRGPPWQLWWAMWPSQHPQGGSQSRHVAFTFCAGGPAGPSLAVSAAGEENFRTLWQRAPEGLFVLFKPTKRLAASKRHMTRNSQRRAAILIWRYRQTGGGTRRPSGGHGRAEGCSFRTLAALNNRPSAPRLPARL